MSKDNYDNKNKNKNNKNIKADIQDGDRLSYIKERKEDISSQTPTTNDYFFFIHHFISTETLILLLCWSLIPVIFPNVVKGSSNFDNANLIQFIISLLPQSKWFIVMECIGLISMMFAYVGINLYCEDIRSPQLTSYDTIVDKQSTLVVRDGKDDDTRFIDQYLFKETSGVIDLNIMDVCDVLYGD